MSEEDNELEQLKKKRLAEMQKNISFKEQKEEKKEEEKEEEKTLPKPRDFLLKRLGYRGLEVLQTAEYQFPREAKMVVDKLGELIQTGEINEEIDGGKLLALFRSVGLNVRVETKINIEQDGKFVSISDKLKTKQNQNSEEPENT